MDVEVSEQVAIEILSRFSINKASKIQCLSKSHAKTANTFYYKHLASQHQTKPFLDGFLLQNIGSNISFLSPQSNSFPPLDLTFAFLPGRDVQIRAAAPNGLLLCEMWHSDLRYKQRFYTICKLSTKQWKGLPLPRTRYFTKNIAMFVLSSNPLHFKILRLSQDQTPSKRPLPYSYTICELFDSKTWCWKLLDDMKSCTFEFAISHHPAIYASGCTHWQMGDGVSIYAFDFYSDTWSKFEKPPMRKNTFQRHTTLVEYEGKLGMMEEFNKPQYSTELWVMENYSHKTWTKKCEFSGFMPMTLYGSEVSVVQLDSIKVMFYNLETGQSNFKKLEDSYLGSPMLFPFFTDFESWNFDPPMRTIKPKTMNKIIRKRLATIQNNVEILVSFYFYFVLYNHYVCYILLETISYALQNL